MKQLFNHIFYQISSKSIKNLILILYTSHLYKLTFLIFLSQLYCLISLLRIFFILFYLFTSIPLFTLPNYNQYEN